VIVVDGAVVYHGSNLDVLPTLPDNSVDSIVTDPPYELGFMGKSWDNSGIAYSVELWTECLRVLKPGGHLLAFGGSRTWHRLAVAIEDAGFEMRDSIAWLYGSGFPKSHNVALGIDKVMGHANRGRAIPTASRYQASDKEEKNKLTSNPVDAYESKSPESEQWQGWGTALKPAFEPVVVARKPFAKGDTVAANILQWGTGGLNIDASRIASDDGFEKAWDKPVVTNISSSGQAFSPNTGTSHIVDLSENRPVGGRWPANIILDPYTADLLDKQSGVSKSSIGHKQTANNDLKSIGNFVGTENIVGHADSGGASRFFYVAKASKRDRNEGLKVLPEKSSTKFSGGPLVNKATGHD
jgi:site-specific DNA-methyltransferase (adenine-specific)